MDKTFYTYEGWKRKLKSLGGNTFIEGNKDIAQGFVNGVNVGEWDGAEGVIFYDRLDRLSKTYFVRQNPKIHSGQINLTHKELEAVRYAVDRTIRWIRKGSFDGLTREQSEKMYDTLSDVYGKVDV
jgi:hypothetical protein